MNKEKIDLHIDEGEAVRAFLTFRSFPADKQVFALAFMNGMDFQKKISEAGRRS